MKTFPVLLSSVLCFTALPKALLALPQDPVAVAGDVSVHQKKAHKMVIKTSDRAIIDYKSFDIGKGEKVRFVQPSASSAVLNRVSGDQASKILGKLEGNGKVLLVNPNGMYFGPHASVRAASFIASALDISNEDFLRDQYVFYRTDPNVLAEIRNDGLLAAAPEGAIVLMAPVIRNLGTIEAKAGKVVLAAGEQVTLDFHGDGLLQFSVEGEIKDAVIEHLGAIHAEGGDVQMKVPTAKRAISEIVNHAGIEKGEVFVEQNGAVYLLPASSVIANKVSLEASTLSVQGKVNVSDSLRDGGEARFAGAQIHLTGAEIDASGSEGGGTVYIGGEYQGSGSMPYASAVIVDQNSKIIADAGAVGNGGTVVLWSTKETVFDGLISAQGGQRSGNGGIVESSSMDSLSVHRGKVDTSASNGEMGQWLLDPTTLTIVGGGGSGPSLCQSGTIDPSTFAASTTNVILCANTINQNANISLTNLGTGILFKAPAGETGIFNTGYDISTVRGFVIVQALDMKLQNDVTINTANSSVANVGSLVSLGSVDSDTTPYGLTIEAGVANVTVGDLGTDNALASVTVNAGAASIASITTNGGDIEINAPVNIKVSSVISSNGGDISFSTINGLIPGAEDLAIAAGTGAVVIGGVGELVPMGDFSILSAADGVQIGNVITQGGDILIRPTVLLVQNLTRFKSFSDTNLYLSGNIDVGDLIPLTGSAQSVTFTTGLNGSVSLKDAGTRDLYLDRLFVNSNQSFTVDNIYAQQAQIENGSAGTSTLNGEVVVSGIFGLLASKIELGGPITASQVNMVSLNSIENATATSYPISIIDEDGELFLDASRGRIGTPLSPININTLSPILLGGNPINITGNYLSSQVHYLPGNRPCLTPFRGQKIPCALVSRFVFNTLPRNVYSRSAYFNAQNLGLGYMPGSVNSYPIQYSAFGKLKAISGNLPPEGDIPAVVETL